MRMLARNPLGEWFDWMPERNLEVVRMGLTRIRLREDANPEDGLDADARPESTNHEDGGSMASRTGTHGQGAGGFSWRLSQMSGHGRSSSIVHFWIRLGRVPALTAW